MCYGISPVKQAAPRPCRADSVRPRPCRLSSWCRAHLTVDCNSQQLPTLPPTHPLVCVQVIRAVAEYLIPRLCGFDEVLMNTMNPILPP